MPLSKAKMRERKQVDRVKPTSNLITKYKGEAILGKAELTLEHPVMKYLIPGEKREKMEAVVKSLKNHNQLGNVYLGCGRDSLCLDFVGELLDTVK